MSSSQGDWDGDRYEAAFAIRSSAGANPHGEVDLVMTFDPHTVLDAGCGTGRVARELSARGVDVVGVDANASMIDTARRLRPDIEWHVADVCELNLGRRFDVVIMAGNVPLFTRTGTEAALVAACARHLSDAGSLVCGFQLGSGYELGAYDDHCRLAGLLLAERWATWEREPFVDGGGYAVSVHRR